MVEHLRTHVLPVIRRSLGRAIAGIYLFGSSVAGGLRPDSDLDILVVVDRPLKEAVRRDLVAGLMKVSGSGGRGNPPRPVEVTVVDRADIVPWRYPPKDQLVYGEWLRAEFEAGRIPPPAFNPDLAIVLATVMQNSLPLFGPEARDLLDPVPGRDIRLSIADSLPTLVDGLRGDERNVLLTLARMWITLVTGRIVTKDTAAGWAIDRLSPEHGSILDLARRAYLGECDDDWTGRTEEVESFIRHVRHEVDGVLS